MIRNPTQNRVSRPRRQKPVSYSESILGGIAEAIGKDVGDVLPHRGKFEAAATWYELDLASPKRTNPSITKKKLEQIGAAARKLLGHLGIDASADASDGPGDMTILAALASVEVQTEDNISRATARLGRLSEIVEAAEAARELESLADEAAKDVTRLGDLTVPKEHQGDAAANNWIASMMGVFQEIGGKAPGTSVVPPGRTKKRGTPDGPLIRFLETAGQPLGICYSPSSWRSRVRTIKKIKPRQK